MVRRLKMITPKWIYFGALSAAMNGFYLARNHLCKRSGLIFVELLCKNDG